MAVVYEAAAETDPRASRTACRDQMPVEDSAYAPRGGAHSWYGFRVPTRSLYGDRDPADVAAYTAADAAALVGVPVSTLRSWVFGRSFQKRTGGVGRSQAIIRTPSAGRFLSFTNVVEAHVLSGLRRHNNVQLANIRRAVRYVERSLRQEHPLAREQFKTDGVDLFVEHLGKLVNASEDGQGAFREVLEEYLERVDYDGGRAVRFFPLHRAGAPRVVVIDPLRAFGRPVLAGTSTPVEDIRARWELGEPISGLATDFAVAADAIEEALRGARQTAA
jgi:uncharacterized protein (DUF433 family)